MTARGELTAAAVAAPGAGAPLALAIDFDGTLFAGDSLVEQLLRLFFTDPFRLMSALPSILKGRAAFKRAVAAAASFDPAHLPYRKEVLELAAKARAGGAPVHLITGADQSIADRVARHLNLFDHAAGSDGARNLVGAAKAAVLTERFPGGFHYVGDSWKDRPVFAAAAMASVVAPTDAAGRRLAGNPGAATILRKRATAKDWIKALRLHHWVKNTLIFVPVALGQLFDDPRSVLLSAIGFVVFGLLASAGYLINDLADIDADRAHPRKRKRAIAGGRIPALNAALLAAGMAAAGFAAALVTDADFALWAGIYFALSFTYSIKLKREPLVDLFVIGALFTVRLIAGMVILDQPVSIWLTGFSFALFASLAFAKRNSELARAVARGGEAPQGRGYRLDDRHLLTAFGVASAMTAMVVMLLYFQFRALSTGLYDDIEALYFAPLVLFSWLLRIWIRAYRGELHDDPIIFALKDRASWAHAAVIIVIWLIADKPGFPS